jgi:hypothetical protein
VATYVPEARLSCVSCVPDSLRRTR